ncbi:MAG TPA: peptidoglycan-binding domain-containing protein [Blastocatellia bacterium]|nr:peptidoglycan-binding domain-containing protein [Blastocatellia bacterium]
MNHLSPRAIVFTILFSLLTFTLAWAQAEPTPPDTSTEEKPLVITRKEVAAVQAELQRRGYFRATPHGLLDAETRGSILLYQKENELEETGRIDMKLLNSLELTYPATGKEVESARKKGLLPRIGYGAKDTATGARDTTVNAGKSVKRTTEKAIDSTKSKSVEVAQDAQDATVKGAKKVGNKTVDTTTRAGRRVSEVFVGRSDAELQRDVRDVLEAQEATARLRTEVKDGVIKVFTKEGVDVSDAVSRIRQLSGVRSVVVVAK